MEIPSETWSLKWAATMIMRAHMNINSGSSATPVKVFHHLPSLKKKKKKVFHHQPSIQSLTSSHASVGPHHLRDRSISALLIGY